MKLAFRSGCRCRPPPANLHACVQATRCSGSLTGSLALRDSFIALACHSDSVFKGRSLLPRCVRRSGSQRVRRTAPHLEVGRFLAALSQSSTQFRIFFRSRSGAWFSLVGHECPAGGAGPPQSKIRDDFGIFALTGARGAIPIMLPTGVNLVGDKSDASGTDSMARRAAPPDQARHTASIL